MKRNVDIVFFGDYKHIVWNEDINNKLQDVFKDLDMIIGKSIETEITSDMSGVQSINIIERPTFSNKAQELNFGVMSNRIDFRFNSVEEIDVQLVQYYEILDKIALELNVPVTRIGINITREINKNLNNKLCKVPILESEKTAEFGIKKNVIKKLNQTNSMTNLLFIIESNLQGTMIFLDYNTVENNNMIIDKKTRDLFLSEATKNFKTLEKDIKKLIGE